MPRKAAGDARGGGDSLFLANQQPTSSHDESISYADFEKLIKEKERDLELAAKIGKSLLDQNRELQERNEFLEESISTTNEAVLQLQYQLQQRSDLLNAFAEYDDQQFNSTSTPEFHSGFIENLENRVKQLESENTKLKNEITQLRDTTEDRQEARVRGYLTQLEKANFKIGQLQLQIGDKNKECCLQAEEIQRLIKEISRRKEKEKSISQENMELQSELNSAVRNHEELRAEIESLQEKYCDIVVILNETQDELRTVQLENVQKTSSLNSLYDSLASELEASDSGFYSTPMVSARQRQSSTEQSAPANALRLELERLDRDNSPIDEFLSAKTTGESSPVQTTSIGTSTCQPSTSKDTTCFYDMPSRVIMDAVKRTMSTEERRRARSASHTPRNQLSLEDSLEASTKSARSPRCSSLQKSAKLETFEEEETLLKDSTSGRTDEELIEDPINNREVAPARTVKSFRDTSCSPIRVDTPPDEPTPRAACARTTSSVFFPYSGATSYMPNSSAEDTTTSHALSSSCPSSSSSEDDGDAETPRSADSLTNYAAPRLGQPGSPGSRDLEFSLRKMQLHKKLSKDYESFRKHRGLAAANVPMYTSRPKSKLTAGAQLASLATNPGPLAPAHPPSASHAQKPNPSTRPKNVASGKRIPNNSLPVRLSTHKSESIRPNSLHRSTSIGLQLWQHSQRQQKQQMECGIDSVTRERMPLVCGVLWRSLAPRTQSTDSNYPPPTQNNPQILEDREQLRRQIVEMPVASGSQIFEALGLSPVRRQTELIPLERLNRFLKFETAKNEATPVGLSDGLPDQPGLTSILSTSPSQTSIVQRSMLHRGPNL